MGKHYKQQIIALINITCFWVLVTYLSLLCEKNKDLHHGSSHTNFKSLNCTKIIMLMSASAMLFTDMPTKVNKASVGQWICNSSLICQQLLWWFISILKKQKQKPPTKFQHWVNVSLSLWVLHKNRPLNLDCTPPSLEPAH